MRILNVLSILFGCFAICVPLLRLKRNNRSVQMFISFTSSLLAICGQVIYQNHLVEIEDWSAIADTSGAVLFATVVLIILTLFSNIVYLVIDINRHEI